MWVSNSWRTPAADPRQLHPKAPRGDEHGRSSSPRSQGATLWLTGLSGAGKTTIAGAIEDLLAESGHTAVALDGDILRTGLSSDLGLSPSDRSEQARRTAHVAALIAGAGLVAVVSLISPYAEDRRRAREIHEKQGLDFLEVWVDTPLRVCQARDPKGLYARARAGELQGVTGLDAPMTSRWTPTSVSAAANARRGRRRRRSLPTPACRFQPMIRGSH